MGARETTPTTSHAWEGQQATPGNQGSLPEGPPFLAPDHRRVPSRGGGRRVVVW